jgi:hypothetical protein
MHRVVVYRDDKSFGGQMVPFTTTAPQGSINPRDLWAWLENYEAKTGGSTTGANSTRTMPRPAHAGSPSTR